MDTTYVGIDVSKDRLDVHVLPGDEAFAVARDGKGVAELIERQGRSAVRRSQSKRPAASRRLWRPGSAVPACR
jgi:hypothetical protein